VNSRIYKEPEWDGREDALRRLSSSDLAVRAEALIALSLHDGDRAFIEGVCLTVLAGSDINLQPQAFTALGHSARRFRIIGEEARLLVESGARAGGSAADALDDVQMFVDPNTPIT